MLFHISHTGALYRAARVPTMPGAACIVKVGPENYDSEIFEDKPISKRYRKIPSELMELILIPLILTHIEYRNLEEALELIGLTRKTIQFFYNYYFDRTPVPRLYKRMETVIQYERLSKTFYLLNEIDSKILQSNDRMSEFYYLELHANSFNVALGSALDPWTFVTNIPEEGYDASLSFVETDVCIGHYFRHFNPFILSGLYADVAWIHGQYKGDYLESHDYWNPVIPMMITTEEGNSISDPKTILKHPSWHGFRKLCKSFYNRHAGLFFVQKHPLVEYRISILL